MKQQGPSHKLVSEPRQLISAPLAQTQRDSLVHTSNNPPDDRSRKLNRFRRMRKAAGEHLLEGLQRPAQMTQAQSTDGLHLNDRQRRPLRVRGELIDELRKGARHVLSQVTGARPIGPADTLDRAYRDQVEGRKEALLLIRELLIEDPSRNTSQRDHLLDTHAGVTAGSDSLDHRSMHTQTLMTDHLLATEMVGASRQTLIQRSRPITRPRPAVAALGHLF